MDDLRLHRRGQNIERRIADSESALWMTGNRAEKRGLGDW